MPQPTTEQLEAYEAAPAHIAAAIDGLGEAQLHHSAGNNEWSIHEVIIHLPDSEAGGFWRLRQTVAEDRPTLPIYDEEAWAKNLSYHTQDRHLALELFSALRHSSAALLRSLPAETWERTCVHPERGPLSLYDVFTLYLEHGHVHLAQIEAIKRAFK